MRLDSESLMYIILMTLIRPFQGGAMARRTSPDSKALTLREHFAGRDLALIIGVLREQEAGARTEEVCRRPWISTATFYKWKSKYGGLEVSDAKRLRALEDENRRLKRLLADSLLDNAALKDLLGKNV